MTRARGTQLLGSKGAFSRKNKFYQASALENIRVNAAAGFATIFHLPFDWTSVGANGIRNKQIIESIVAKGSPVGGERRTKCPPHHPLAQHELNNNFQTISPSCDHDDGTILRTGTIILCWLAEGMWVIESSIGQVSFLPTRER